MKRIITFNKEDEQYQFSEDGNTIFCIPYNDLQFDVGLFYKAFFSTEKDWSDIELKCSPIDAKGKHVFEITKNLISEIVMKINEKKATEQEGA